MFSINRMIPFWIRLVIAAVIVAIVIFMNI